MDAPCQHGRDGKRGGTFKFTVMTAQDSDVLRRLKSSSSKMRLDLLFSLMW